jgi:hypothetical protein
MKMTGDANGTKCAFSLLSMSRHSCGKLFITGFIVLFAASSAFAQILVGSPTTDWSAIQYTGVVPDFSMDEQATSIDADIVGNSANPSFYRTFWDGGTQANLIDGEIGFRLRVAGDKNPAGFNGVAYVGVDVTGDGSLDLFLGASTQGGTNLIGIWLAGNGLNTSPSNTTVSSTALYSAPITSSNFNWSPINSTIDPSVTNINIDGGSGGGADHTDHFLSFALPFSELVSATANFLPGGITENSLLRFVAATSTQQNSLNQDINGLPRIYDGSQSWSSLGVLSEPVPATTTLSIPEPSAFFSSLGAFLLLFARRRR